MKYTKTRKDTRGLVAKDVILSLSQLALTKFLLRTIAMQYVKSWRWEATRLKSACYRPYIPV